MIEEGAASGADGAAPNEAGQAPSLKPRFELGWYNGWSPDERRATLAVQKAAIKSGELAKPAQCSVCLVRGSRDWQAQDAVWLHDERYDRPLEAYPICRRCHRLLHSRFDDPAPWLALVAEHARGGAWFEGLSMDPASQRRPFADTYPHGLPSASGARQPAPERTTTHLGET